MKICSAQSILHEYSKISKELSFELLSCFLCLNSLIVVLRSFPGISQLDSRLILSHLVFAMAPCQRCGKGTRSGRGYGWCSDPQCRRAEQEERQAQASAKRRALQQERAANGGGSRGPLPLETATARAQKRELQSQRNEEGVASRGRKPQEDSTRTQKRELQSHRKEEGSGQPWAQA